jgi:serine/threonine protein kinase
MEGRLKRKLTVKQMFYEVVIAIQYLHEQGIAHNDIKPENVMIDDCGQVKLADFVFAKNKLILNDDEKCGTLMYAAPELLHSGS